MERKEGIAKTETEEEKECKDLGKRRQRKTDKEEIKKFVQNHVASVLIGRYATVNMSQNLDYYKTMSVLNR